MRTGGGQLLVNGVAIKIKGVNLAVGETVIVLHLSLALVGVWHFDGDGERASA